MERLVNMTLMFTGYSRLATVTWALTTQRPFLHTQNL